MAGCKGPCYSEFQLATLRCDPYVCVVRSTATAVVTPIRCVICRCTLLNWNPSRVLPVAACKCLCYFVFFRHLDIRSNVCLAAAFL